MSEENTTHESLQKRFEIFEKRFKECETSLNMILEQRLNTCKKSIKKKISKETRNKI